MTRWISLIFSLGIVGCREVHPDPLSLPWAGTAGQGSAPTDTTEVRTTGGSVWAKAAFLVDSTTEIPLSVPLVRRSRLAWGDSGSVWVAVENRLQRVGPNSEEASPIGRSGRGPGEFLSIDGLYAWGNDSVMVWDGKQYRLTFLTSDGKVLHTTTIAPPPLYGSALSVDLYPCNGGVLLAWSGDMVRPDGPPDTTAVAFHNLRTGQADVVARIAGDGWTSAGGVLVPHHAYGPRVRIAVGPGCLLAISDGVAPCVLRRMIDRGSAGWQQACWWRPSAPPPSGVRSADQLRSISMTVQERKMYAQIIETQELSEHRNALNGLRIDDRGRIWARLTDMTTSVHPMVLAAFPETGDSVATWDLIAPDGRLLGAVQLPSRLDGMIVRGNTLVGVQVDGDGDWHLVRTRLSLVN